MPLQTINWLPDIGSQVSIKPIVKVVKFGDGYEQRTSSVINNRPEIWTVKFTKGINDIIAMEQTLNALGGLTAFRWATPHNQTKTFVCREWNVTRQSTGLSELSCKFEQVFES